MIPLNFYRDDEYVYYNNPNGITKKMTIADFESMMSGESELPTYSSSSQGKVLSVDSEGDLEWTDLPPAELPAYTSSDGGKVLTVNSGGTGVEWGEGGGGGASIVGMATLSNDDAGSVAINSGSLASFFLTDYRFVDVNGSVVDDIPYDWCALIGYHHTGGGALIIKQVDANSGTITVYNPTDETLYDAPTSYTMDILLFKVN